jgi:hypothetical protein
MDVGTEEGPMDDWTAAVNGKMIALGFKDGVDIKMYVDQGGLHSGFYWGDRFYLPMTFLYPPSIQN